MSGQWMETGGRVEPLKFQPAPYVRPSVSPDGERVALEHRGDAANQDIWIYEWKRDTMRRLTFDAGSKGLAQIWSRDGRYLVFNGMSGLYWVRSDGAGNPQRLTHSENVHIPGSFSPDGRLAFMEVEAGGNQAVWTLPLEIVDGWPRAGKPEVFLKNSFNNGSPKFSPDGRWIAYSSNESGDSQIYVRAYPDRGAKWQISSKGGARPIWSRNGRELFFTSGDGRINVVSYAVKGDSLLADQPKVWSEWRSTDASSTFDLTPDGKRIFALVPANAADAQQDQHHLVLLLNFADELQRKVRTGK
jgi:serine/threonine-protein kinase